MSSNETPTIISERRPRSSSYRLLPWLLYIGGSWAFLYPILVTAIVADDYLNPFLLFQRAGSSPREVFRYSWDNTQSAGHFNYLGQIFGNFVSTATMLLMSVFGVRYSLAFALTKLVVFLFTALAASAFTRLALDAMGRPQSAWRCRVVVSALLFGMLQLHIAWSNDPVGSFPLAGFGSAAVGFVALCYGLKAVLDRRYVWLAVLTGVVAILYYELNIATAVALVPLVAWAILREWRLRTPLLRAAVRFLPIVVIPGIATVILQLGAAPSSATYKGTAVDSGSGRLLGTFWDGLVGGLPGASWALTRKWIHRPVALQLRPIIIFAVLATAVLLVVTRRETRVRERRSRRPPVPLAVILSIPILYWLVTTLIQSATEKVQNETHGIGYVYNYYAVSVSALAVVGAICAFVIPWSRVPRLVSHGLVVGVSLFVFLQLMFNWNLLIWFNQNTLPNQALLVAYSDEKPTASRCTALVNWTGGAWPDYYEKGMVDGLQFAYHHFHGVDFCPGFVDTTLTGP